MQTTHIKKITIFWLHNSKKMLYMILGMIFFLLSFIPGLQAQNSDTKYGIDALKTAATLAGNYNSAFGYQTLYSNTDGFSNTAVGSQALYSNIRAMSNTANGVYALYLNTKGSANTASGYSALYYNTAGSSNTANGVYALYLNTTGNFNTANGYSALYYNKSGNGNTANGVYTLNSNTTGNFNTASGHQALYSNQIGVGNTINGYTAAYYNKGNFNTTSGHASLFSNTDGGSNTANGYATLYSNTTGSFNTASGYASLRNNTTGNYNTAIGYQADVSSPNLTNATAIGNGAIANSSNTIQLGDNKVTRVFAGVSNLAVMSDNARVIVGGLQITGGAPATGKVLTSDVSGIATWQNLDKSCWSLRGNSGINDSINFIGTTDNVAFNIRVNNEQSGRIDPKTLNASYGYQSSNSITTGTNNTAMGSKALSSNTTGNYNVALGGLALKTNATGSNNTAIGYAADVDMGLNNATAIGSKAKATVSNSIQLGNDAVAEIIVGVGKTATLVTGGLQITGSTPSTGKVLTSDANGRATWQTPVVNGWYLTGNSGIADSINFIGTTNDADLVFKRYNTIAGRLLRDSSIAIGLRALSKNINGKKNTAVGCSALSTSQYSSKNTAIGCKAIVPGIRDSNATSIGYFVKATTRHIVIGNTSVTSIGGCVNWSILSDRRIKKDVEEKVPGLAFITKLRPVTYYLDMDAMAKFLEIPNNLRLRDAERLKALELQTGFIAQEVEKVANEMGFEFSGVDKPKNENDLYGLRYEVFTVPLIKAIQEQQQQIKKQRKQIDELKQLVVDITKTNNEAKAPTALLEEEVELYPNPTTGVFIITSNHINDGTIEIYNMLGHKIQTVAFKNAKLGYQFNVSGYAKGIYLLNIISGNKRYTKKLVIQ